MLRKPVVDVQVRGNVLVPGAVVIERLGVGPGMLVSELELHERVAETNEWGGFGDLTYNIAYHEDGMVIGLSLAERLELRRVELRGNRALSDDRLLSVIALESGRVLDPEAARLARERLVGYYRERGYELTSAAMAGRFHDDGTCTLVLDISEGARLRVRRIHFTGNTAFSKSRLRRAMDTHVYLPLPFIKHGRLDEDEFYDDMREIEEMYHNAGYLNAKVSGYWTYTSGFGGYELNVVIYEGPRYRVAGIEVEGNRLFRDGEIVESAGISVGDVFTYDMAAEVGRNVANLYATQGLVDVREADRNLLVDPVVVDSDEGRVEMRIAINETEPVFVRRIRVEGLTKTDELVVMRHLKFEPGDRVDMDVFRSSERALRDTGYFDLSHPRPVGIELAPGPGMFRDVVVTVREGPTGNLMLGGGVSEDAGFFGNVSITERNFDITNWPQRLGDFRDRSPFRGGGQELSLMVNVGTERSDASVSFREPRFRHTDYSLGFRAYSRLGMQKYYDTLRTGGGVFVGRYLGEYVYQQLEIGVEHIHVTGMSDDAPREIARDDDTYLKPYIDLSLRRDTRDSTMFPTSGYVARLGPEMAMGDIQTLQLTGSMETYWPVYEQKSGRKQVFMLRGRGGVMGTYGGRRRIPVFERFYGGGRGSVRGFQHWGVAPVEPEEEEQVGGRSMLTGTAEYTIPIFTDHFRVAFFLDAGYVEERARDVFSGWDKLRVSSGAGIRWFIPALGGIPVSLDFAFPIEKEDYDATQTIHFHLGLGHAF